MPTSLERPAAHATRPFLTAAWRKLAMANFVIDPRVLAPHIPAGTRLDTDNGVAYVSIVGFEFVDTRLLGFAVPGHTNFEEVNLRFYVVREVAGETRRGTVFIKELAPRWAVCTLARLAYNEKYQCVPMRSSARGFDPGAHAEDQEVRYEWKLAGRWHSLHMNAGGPAQPLAAGSHEEFIAEHYWGYSRQRRGGTLEYRVEHPRWNVWSPAEVSFDWDIRAVYGSEFVETLSARPVSAFVAEGSPITIFRPEWVS